MRNTNIQEIIISQYDDDLIASLASLNFHTPDYSPNGWRI